MEAFWRLLVLGLLAYVVLGFIAKNHAGDIGRAADKCARFFFLIPPFGVLLVSAALFLLMRWVLEIVQGRKNLRWKVDDAKADY